MYHFLFILALLSGIGGLPILGLAQQSVEKTPEVAPEDSLATELARRVIGTSGEIVGHLIGRSGEQVLFLKTGKIVPEWVRLHDGVVEGDLGMIGRIQASAQGLSAEPAPVFQISYGRVAVEIEGDGMLHRLVEDAELPGITIPAGTVIFRGEREGDAWIGQTMTRTLDCGDYWTDARILFGNVEPAQSSRMETYILAPAPSADACNYTPGTKWIGPYSGERVAAVRTKHTGTADQSKK